MLLAATVTRENFENISRRIIAKDPPSLSYKCQVGRLDDQFEKINERNASKSTTKVVEIMEDTEAEKAHNLGFFQLEAKSLNGRVSRRESKYLSFYLSLCTNIISRI